METLVETYKDLQPPQNLQEAAFMAVLGPQIIPLLKRNPLHDAKRARACIRALSYLTSRRYIDSFFLPADGYSEAVEALGDYRSDNRKTIHKELQFVTVTKSGPRFTVVPTHDLDTVHLHGTKSLEGISCLKHIKKLTLDNIHHKLDLRPLVFLPDLEELTLSSYHFPQNLSILKECANLHILRLNFQPWSFYKRPDLFKILEVLLQLKQITTIEIPDARGGMQVTDLPTLARYSILRRKGIINSFYDLHFFTVSSLELSSFRDELSDLSLLDGFSDLRKLILSHCSLISNLSPLTALPELREVIIAHCTNIQTLAPLAALSQLTHLNLVGWREMPELDFLAQLAHLTHLEIIPEAREVDADLSPLASSSGLTFLRVRDLAISSLAPLTKHNGLVELSLTRCPNITDLAPLAGLTSLRELNLYACRNLSDLNPLSSLSNLISLNIGRTAVRDLTPLASLPALQRVYICGCQQMSDFSSLTRRGIDVIR